VLNIPNLDEVSGRRVGRRLAADDAADVLRRAKLLPDADRRLIELAVRGTLSCRQIGGAIGVGHGTVARRLARVLARLRDPLVVALLEPTCPLAPEYRQLGVEHFLQGKSMIELADTHRMDRRRVRDVLNFIRGWHGGMAARYAGVWRKAMERRGRDG